jgi:PAS domain S-box-containing protein
MAGVNTSAEIPSVLGTGRDAFIALALMAVGFAIRLGLNPLLGSEYPYLPFFLATVFSAWRCGWKISAAIAVSGLLMAHWFFIPPLYTLNLSTSSTGYGAGSYLIASAAVVTLGEKLRRQNLRLQIELNERRQTAEELRSVAHFPEQNPAPVMRIAADGTLLYANPGSKALLQRWQTAVNHPVPEHIRSWLADILHSKGIAEKDQEIGNKTFTFVAAPFPELGYVNLYGQDTTERKLAERALRESEFRFRMMANASPAMIWISDIDKRYVWFNTAWLAFVGRTLELKHENRWAEDVHPEDHQRCMETFTRAFDARETFEMEYRLRRHDGQHRWILDRGTPVYDPDGKFKGYIGSCVDVHEQHVQREDLERAVRERTTQLQESVAELESFSYSIAHDMRAPLRAMHGFGKILMQESVGLLEEPHREYLRRIIVSAQRLDVLIQDVLNYSRVSRSDLPVEKLDLESFIRDILVSYPDFAHGKASIEIDGRLPSVLANRAALTQVISNLLGNAVKFVDPGVFPHVRISARPEGECSRLSFRDNGIGIEPESHDRIFQMLQRLNRSDLYEGTGIGLAIVRKAVERMGGAVSVESEPGKGSTFHVILKSTENA